MSPQETTRLSVLGPVPKIHAGTGRISLSRYGPDAVFSELSSTYPLKLLSPRITHAGVALVYLMTYGGGLVSGDQVTLSVDVSLGATLVLLSQGSTKIFKTRPGVRFDSVANAAPDMANAHTSSLLPSMPLATSQKLTFTIAANSALFLLPDPVTCFRSSSYTQTQIFHLHSEATIVVLDWLTSGRKSTGENWVFSRYFSGNEVWVDGKVVAKDVMLLEEHSLDAQLPKRSLADRLAPYSCYAMLILYGPLAQAAIDCMTAQYDLISILKSRSPAEMVWSLSPICPGGAVVRIAGNETEVVKKWLGTALEGIASVVGVDAYRRMFA